MPLSAKQCEYLALAWQCLETEPKIDYEKFKSLANLASAASARELLRVTKKKLKEEYGASFGGGEGSTPATPAGKGNGTPAGKGKGTTPASTPGARKKGVAKKVNGAGTAGGVKGRGKGRKRSEVESEGGSEGEVAEDDGEEMGGPRKRVKVKAEPVEEMEEENEEELDEASMFQ